MPLTGLVRLLQTQQLHLANSNAFEDILEGKFGVETIIQHLKIGQVDVIGRALRTMKNDCFISCWHLSSSESLAMWRLYGRSDSSIAIVSDVGTLMSIGNDFCASLEFLGMFGEVVYGNSIQAGRMTVNTIGLPFGYRELPLPTCIQLFFCKAPEFEYEREWRLVLWQKGSSKTSIQLPILEPKKFIKQILVSPEASDWVVETVRDLIQVQFGLKDIKVDRSGLSRSLRAIRH